MQINTRPCTFSCVHIARVSWSISGSEGHVIAELWWSTHARVGEVEVVAESEKWVPLQMNARPCTFSCIHIARVSL